MEEVNLDKHFFENANFAKRFPLLSTSIVDVVDTMRKECRKYTWNYSIVFDILTTNYYDEIDSVAGPYWKKLQEYNDGYVNLHWIFVYYWTVKDPEFNEELTDEERNILEWAALFHDISKRGLPLFNSKDFVHPFQSAAIMLKIFKDHVKYIKVLEDQEESWNETVDFIFNAVEEVKKEEFPDIYYDEDCCHQLHDTIKLPEILEKLSKFIDPSSPVMIVFKLILLHQSIYVMREFCYPKMLSSEEILKYLNENELRLLKILMNNDWFSYSLPHPDRKEWKRRRDEVDWNVKKLIKLSRKSSIKSKEWFK